MHDRFGSINLKHRLMSEKNLLNDLLGNTIRFSSAVSVIPSTKSNEMKKLLHLKPSMKINT